MAEPLGSFVASSAALEAAHLPGVVSQRHTREEAIVVKTTLDEHCVNESVEEPLGDVLRDGASGCSHGDEKPLEKPLGEVLRDGAIVYSSVPDQSVRLDKTRFRFCEFFAGAAALTAAVDAVGVPVRCPDDLTDGGVNFLHLAELAPLRKELFSLLASGVQLSAHFAPPCATFSRARDRNDRTRLRSNACPQGFPRVADRTREANLVARHTLDLVEELAKKGAFVTLENPESSYLWNYLDFDAGVEFEDICLTACMFGAPYMKATRIRCWNWAPNSLRDKRCRLSQEVFSCGRSQQEGHRVLEFGGASTKEAAAYVPLLCEAWALDIRHHLENSTDRVAAVDLVARVSHGPVSRHVLRGPTEDSARAVRKTEDDRCTAGCRNPVDLEANCPDLWSTMSRVRTVLADAHASSSDLRGLAGCLGASPSREPPLESSLADVRRGLEVLFHVPRGVFEEHHPASTGGRS